MNKPLVSILVPAHNAAPYLPELCKSIQAQTHQNFEVLITNDGSDDNTLEVLKPFRTDTRFQILSWQKNRGVTSATLALFGIFSGKYWCHPGADDVLFPHFIEKRVALLEENPNAAITHGAAEYIDETGQTTSGFSLVPKLPIQMDGERALGALLQHNFINTPSIMVRSSVTKLVLPFFASDWMYAQDWYFWLLHLATGFDLLWDTEPLHKYRIHSQSLSNAANKAAVRRAEERLIPLCALSSAARFSQVAARRWAKWGSALYALWLRRAFSLHREKMLQNEWLQTGGFAFYGAPKENISLFAELGRHGMKIVNTARKEKKAIASQSFRVSGLAQIDDPIFR